MASIIIISLFFLYVLLSLFSPKLFVLFTLTTGGLPLDWFSEKRGFLTMFKGIAAPAVIEFGVIIGSIIIIAGHLKRSSFVLSKSLPHLYFLIFCAMSLIWTSDFIFGLRMFLKLFAPFTFLLAAGVIVQSFSDLRSIEKAVFISATISLMVALSNYFFKYAPIFVSRSTQYLTVPGWSPALFSFHIGCATILSLINYIVSKKKIYLFYFVIFSLGILFAFTRISIIAYIAAVSVCIIMLVKSNYLKLVLPLVLCLLFVFAVFFSDTLSSRMFQNPEAVKLEKVITDPGSLSSNIHGSGRFLAWQNALKKFFYRNQLIGAGAGATQAWFYSGSKERVGVLHSEYLRILCEFGIMGAILFLFVVVAYGARIIKIFVKSENNLERKYSALAFSLLTFYLVTLASDNSFDYIRTFGNYVFVFIACAFIANKFSKNPAMINSKCS